MAEHWTLNTTLCTSLYERQRIGFKRVCTLHRTLVDLRIKSALVIIIIIIRPIGIIMFSCCWCIYWRTI